MFFRRLFSSRTEKHALLIEVGSGDVRISHTLLTRTGKPVHLQSVTAPFPWKTTRATVSLTEDMLTALKQAAETIKIQVPPSAIAHVAVFLHAPWSTTTLRTYKVARTKPFMLSQKLIEKMLQEETGEEDLPSGERLIERVPLGLRLNGYTVETISEVPVTSAEVTVGTTTAVKTLLSQMVTAIGPFPFGTKTTFHSFTLPAVYALAHIEPLLGEALLLDVGREVTEAISIRGSLPVGRGTAPVGTGVAHRTLASHGNMTFPETQTAVKLGAVGAGRVAEEVAPSLLASGTDWAQALKSILLPLSSEGSMPNTLYVFADTQELPWIERAIHGEHFFAAGGTGSVRVVPLTSESFSSFIENKEGAIPGTLAALLLFADTRFDEHKTLQLFSTREVLLKGTHATL